MTQATRPTHITCARCGEQKAVEKRGPVPAYCSGACRAGTANDRRIGIQCAHCRQPAKVRPGAMYCSAQCRNAANYGKAKRNGKYDEMLLSRRQQTEARRQANARPCPYCPGQVLSPRGKHCGAAECKRAFNAERARTWHRNYTAETGQRYGRVNYPERESEYRRRRREAQGHWRKQYPERASLIDARRRMRMSQARTDEAFAPIDVHTRDEWTCQLCRLPIDPEVAWPDRMSPSIDHVIPLSRGGTHSMSNVQSAHLGCNSRKADKVDEAA